MLSLPRPFTYKYPIWLLCFLALVATALIGVFASKLESTYLRHWPRFYDALSYDSQNANLYLDEKKVGRVAMLVHEIQHNNRNVFRTIPLLLFAPSLLSKQYGQLATSLPLLFCFIFMLAYETYRCSRSILIAILAIVCAVSFPGLIHPVNGYAANWLDMPASMAMGTAVLALLHFVEFLNLRWLAIFGIFATITATCRWSAAPYLAFYGAPVLLLGLYRFAKRKGSVKDALRVFLLSAGIGISFVVYHIPSTYWYYSKVCFGMGSTVMQALDCTVDGLKTLLGSALLVVLLGLIALNFLKLLIVKPPFWRVLNCLCNIWFPVSLFVFLCFVLKSSQAVHPMVYLVPALLISAFANDRKPKASRSVSSDCIAAIASCLLLWQIIGSYHCFIFLAKHPFPDAIAAKSLDMTLANYMANNHIRTYSEYDDERSMATMDCFYASGWKPNFREKSFSIHEPYFKAWYPKKTPIEVAKQILDDDEKEVDLILIHDDIAEISKNSAMNNVYSQTISAYMSQMVPKSPNWSKVAVWSGPYGNLGVYRNTKI